MATVGEVMSRKLLTVEPTTTAAEAAERMSERGVGAALVLTATPSRGSSPSATCCARSRPARVEGTHVAAWMTRDPETVDVVGVARPGGGGDDPRRLPPPAGARRRQARRHRLDPGPDARRRRRREPAWRLVRTGMFVDGAWTSSLSGETFTADSPATGETIGEVPQGDRDDAQLAIGAANRAADALGAHDRVRARGRDAPHRGRSREAARRRSRARSRSTRASRSPRRATRSRSSCSTGATRPRTASGSRAGCRTRSRRASACCSSAARAA